MRRTKIHGDKGYHTALITIKQGDQHSGPNRDPKHNQDKTKIYYLFRHVHVLTRMAKIHVVTMYIRADGPVIYMSQTMSAKFAINKFAVEKLASGIFASENFV